MSEKKTDNFKRYVDPTGEFTNKDLALSSWYVRHRILLRKIFIGILLGWAIVGGLIALILWGSYLFSGLWKDREMRRETLASFQDFQSIQQNYSAQNLKIGGIQVFQNGEKYDFFAFATNPNKNFIARVRYKYTFEGRETEEKVVVIAPGKKVPLIVYGYEGAFPTGAKLEILDTRWRKINPHLIPDTEGYMRVRTNFLIDYLNVEHSVLSGEVPARITFDITNNTAYSYYEARFAIVLLSGSTVDGVVPLTLKNFRAGDKIPVDIRPSVNISSVDDVEIIPLMDVFDQNEYLEVGK